MTIENLRQLEKQLQFATFTHQTALDLTNDIV